VSARLASIVERRHGTMAAARAESPFAIECDPQAARRASCRRHRDDYLRRILAPERGDDPDELRRCAAVFDAMLAEMD
jgi:hypothetical protein